jgi:hypothetical protein
MINVLIEMSARNMKIIMFLGSKVRRVRKADKLTAIHEPIVYTRGSQSVRRGALGRREE